MQMKDKWSDEEKKAVLDSLNKAIETAPWHASNFLKAIGKKLEALRDKYLTYLSPDAQHTETKPGFATRLAQRSGQQEIYISLYSSDGGNLSSWERIVMNLPHQTISRPIYANETDVRALLRTKDNKQNEAFVAIYINQSDILPLPPERSSIDKLGVPLLSLKDNALDLNNISRFVHQSGVYQWYRSRLLPQQV
jgi:intracellular multiplication protein IcmQ